ncbi:MAG: EGFR-like transmembrane domain-containing protein [Blautia sp.]
MKKWKRLLVSLLTVSMTLGASTMSVMADDTTPYTYKVTLSAGNKGTINGQNKIEQANIAPDSTVTFNLNDIQVTDDKYYVKGIRLSGRDNDEALAAPSFTVDKDTDYVVAYGIKGNMVAYTVNYQDASGKSLAESQTFYGNVGDKPVVAYRYVENYIPDALALTKTLSNNESENVFTFTYKPGATDRVVTTTTTVTTTVPGTATPAGAAGTTGAAGTAGAAAGTGTGTTVGGTTVGGTTVGGTTVGGTTAGGTTAGGTTTGGTAGGTTNADNSQDTTDDTTTEPDEQTPKSLVDLDDEDTPKGNIDAKDKTSKTPIAAGIGIIVVAVAALVGLIVFLKKRAK